MNNKIWKYSNNVCLGTVYSKWSWKSDDVRIYSKIYRNLYRVLNYFRKRYRKPYYSYSSHSIPSLIFLFGSWGYWNMTLMFVLTHILSSHPCKCFYFAWLTILKGAIFLQHSLRRRVLFFYNREIDNRDTQTCTETSDAQWSFGKVYSLPSDQHYKHTRVRANRTVWSVPGQL